MNNGSDSEFYLRKGFRVVAIEANPELARQAADRLRPFVDSGALRILNVGVHETTGEFDFYVNLDNPDWSSFVRHIGTRNDTRFAVVKVPCVPFSAIFQEYGIPYYLKIDIEMHDHLVLEAMHRAAATPRYVSVEAHHIGYMAHLWVMGYRKFKLVNQQTLRQHRCANPPLEGVFVDARFDVHMSGPFGEESPGEWKKYEAVVQQFLTDIRTPEGKNLAGTAWFDVHARMD